MSGDRFNMRMIRVRLIGLNGLCACGNPRVHACPNHSTDLLAQITQLTFELLPILPREGEGRANQMS